ncbi:MAG TPA: EFR1 family ferrodoxin [Candidatus Coprenecus pullistercoris]|nr:EFR1 family ferrodoxin [Candidatus Coprenecus pullistercoris]
MIFYFSGTGNSLWVAKRLSKALGHAEPVSVADELRRIGPDGLCCYALGCEEPLVLVFPVHSWGPAVMMLRFVRRLEVKDYVGQKVYAVCTCGDTCGLTDRMIGEALGRRGLPLTACWSVQMPNNYILMKGFGVDSDELRDAKLEAAPAQVDGIAEAISAGSAAGSCAHRHYVTGTQPWMKSRIVNPLFRRFMAGPGSRTKFHVSDACIGCGLCERVCPTGTVTMSGGRPVWGRGCVQCTACINRCPVRAIDWDGITQSQGRYHYPGL